MAGRKPGWTLAISTEASQKKSAPARTTAWADEIQNWRVSKETG
jgi:hypothetical protein